MLKLAAQKFNPLSKTPLPINNKPPFVHFFFPVMLSFGFHAQRLQLRPIAVLHCKVSHPVNILLFRQIAHIVHMLGTV